MMRLVAALCFVMLSGMSRAATRVIDGQGKPLVYKTGQWALTISTPGPVVIKNWISQAIVGPKDRTNPLSTDVPCGKAVNPVDLFGCGGPVKITGNAGPVYILHNRFDQPAEKQVQVEPQMVQGKLLTPSKVYIALNVFGGYFAVAADDQAEWTHAQLAAAGTMKVYFVLNDCTHVYRRCALAQGPNVELLEINNQLAAYQYPGTTDRGFPIVSRGEAIVLAQGNVIAGPGKPWEAADVGPYQNAQSIEPRATGSLKAVDNTLSGGATLTEVQPEKVTVSYPFSVTSPDVLPSILAHAGPQ